VCNINPAKSIDSQRLLYEKVKFNSGVCFKSSLAEHECKNFTFAKRERYKITDGVVIFYPGCAQIAKIKSVGFLNPVVGQKKLWKVLYSNGAAATK